MSFMHAQIIYDALKGGCNKWLRKKKKKPTQKGLIIDKLRKKLTCVNRKRSRFHWLYAWCSVRCVVMLLLGD